MKYDESHDVLILGAGIGGSATAIRLAKRGIKALVVDKSKFPRDIVGEGLSPGIAEHLDELGVLEEVDRNENCLKKASIQLVSIPGNTSYTHVDLNKKHYSDGGHQFEYGWNVRRRDFDHILFKKAEEHGAEMRTEVMAKEVIYDAETDTVEGVVLKDLQANREYVVKTRVVIDCTGRNSVIGKQLSLKDTLQEVMDGQWANFAIRTEFRNVNLDPLVNSNENYDPATVSFLPAENCWYWFIPLNIEEKLYSIGFVARSKIRQKIKQEGLTTKESYQLLIEQHPVLKKVIEGAEMQDNYVSTSQLGHLSKKMAGKGFLSVGDSAFFADPAWGTGVLLALRSSRLAVDVVADILANNDDADLSLSFDEYERQYMKMISDPFNNIRAFNYYYNDTEYFDFIVQNLAEEPEDMDMIGAVIFDYASHTKFQDWTYKQFKRFVAEKGRFPVMDKVSQIEFDEQLEPA